MGGSAAGLDAGTARLDAGTARPHATPVALPAMLAVAVPILLLVVPLWQGAGEVPWPVLLLGACCEAVTWLAMRWVWPRHRRPALGLVWLACCGFFAVPVLGSERSALLLGYVLLFGSLSFLLVLAAVFLRPSVAPR